MYVGAVSAQSVPATIRLGAKGSTVSLAQRSLNEFYQQSRVAEDGVFNAALDLAVREFQRNNKDADGKQLVIDGIVGPRTWSALLGLPRVPVTNTVTAPANVPGAPPPANAPPVLPPKGKTPWGWVAGIGLLGLLGLRAAFGKKREKKGGE